MTDDALKARRFRDLAYRSHATLDSSDDAESRYTFRLMRGEVVTSRHLIQVIALVKAAEDAWGRGRGEHKELLDLRAFSADLNGSVPETNIVWSRAAKSGTVRFGDWLADQTPIF